MLNILENPTDLVLRGGAEYLSGFLDLKTDNHMAEHLKEVNPEIIDDNKEDIFSMKVTRAHRRALSRQLGGAFTICELENKQKSRTPAKESKEIKKKKTQNS